MELTSFPIKITQIPARKLVFFTTVHDLFIFIIQSSLSQFVLRASIVVIYSNLVPPNTCDHPK